MSEIIMVIHSEWGAGVVCGRAPGEWMQRWRGCFQRSMLTGRVVKTTLAWLISVISQHVSLWKTLYGTPRFNTSGAIWNFYSTWVKLTKSLGYLRAESHVHTHSRWSAATGLNVSQCFSCDLIDQRLSRAIVKYRVKRLRTSSFSNYWVMDCLSSIALVNEWITHANKDEE